MFKSLRSKVSLLLLLNLFLLSSVDINCQEASIHSHVKVKTKSLKGGNKHRTTVTLTIVAKKNDKKEKIKIKKSAKGSTIEESKNRACAKVNESLFKRIFKRFKKKGSGNQVMADENGEGDYKSGGDIIIIFGSGDQEDSYPNQGDQGVATLRYKNFEEFEDKAKSDIYSVLTNMPIEME